MDNTDTESDFDAADLADAILAPPAPPTAPPPAVPSGAAPTWTEAQRAAVTLLAILIVLLLIGLAVMAGDGRAEQPCEPEPLVWSHDDRDDRGLFDDAEDRFAPAHDDSFQHCE